MRRRRPIRAAPIEHEAAILNPVENAVEDTARAFHQDFAPGAGELEEEIIDDEDFHTTLHASSVEELDDFDEEETLEGAADLGTMIREMSIDQITSSGVEEDDEEDFEEEDSIDDRTLDDLVKTKRSSTRSRNREESRKSLPMARSLRQPAVSIRPTLLHPRRIVPAMATVAAAVAVATDAAEIVAGAIAVETASATPVGQGIASAAEAVTAVVAAAPCSRPTFPRSANC